MANTDNYSYSETQVFANLLREISRIHDTTKWLLGSMLPSLFFHSCNTCSNAKKWPCWLKFYRTNLTSFHISSKNIGWPRWLKRLEYLHKTPMEFLVHETSHLNMVLNQLSISCFESVPLGCLWLVASSSPNTFVFRWLCHWKNVQFKGQRQKSCEEIYSVLHRDSTLISFYLILFWGAYSSLEY